MNHHDHGRRLSRREAIRRGALGAAALAAGGAAPRQTLAAPPKAPAKSVIQIWMWGGPSHLDTFDPKPEAGEAYHGPYDSPIATNVDGIRIGEKLPLLARHADKYAIIRSMTHGINAHETASYITQTGRAPGRLVYPCVGAVVSLLKGVAAGYQGVAPPYVVLTTPQGRFSEAGFLGPAYKPFATGGDPSRDVFAVEGIVARGMTDQRQRQRRQLLGDLDTLGPAVGDNAAFARFDANREEAYETIFGPARELFDLGGEDASLRDRYGRNWFGQSCLMARRLVESGVPYVTINYRGWDTHKQHFETMETKLPELDAGFATLLQDLADRDLLENTIVWWSGEFGRGPKIQWESPWNGGRSHHGRCFSAVLAGGGFSGGTVVGKSDARGIDVAERPVYPRDLIGSVYQRLGIDPEAKLPNPRNLDVRVMPADEEGAESGGRLTEIMS